MSNPQPERARILVICTLDLMASVLLKPWLTRLAEAGYEVHLACTRTTSFDELADAGFRVHEAPLRRRFNPLSHVIPLWKLYRLMRRERFLAVNCHSPVAAAVGRLAALLARAPLIIYTVHGFYFHDMMPALPRRLFIGIEWLLGRITNYFMFVSDEDRQTSLRTGIAADARATTTIYNGIDLATYIPKAADRASTRELRRDLGIVLGGPVIGIVGRIVREKGYREFLGMAQAVAARHADATFLVVGDALPSDRDRFGGQLKQGVRAAGLEGHFRFTGFTKRVADYLQVMDIFVLPSWREGFPCSVLEAMATGLPVVATNIRGCREAVVHGQTGLIIPPGNAPALTDAVLYLLDHPEVRRRMGEAGRHRVVELYDQRLVQERFVAVFDRLLGTPSQPGEENVRCVHSGESSRTR
jgi:glycosyltransferase involved in cell wall biosynthesis